MTARQASAAPTSGRRLLAILMLVFVFNFVDRQIVGILAAPIKTELGLSDTELGVMGGIAFALFYTGLGIPIAWLADRKSRVVIVAVSLGLWSVFTALCGCAQTFWQLFFARMGVGVGEAGGLAPCYSLLADTFPPERRGRALAVLSLGIPVGSSIGIVFGGWIATAIDWRAAFLIVGLPGLLLVPVVLWGIREPARGRFDGRPGAPTASAQPLPAVLRAVAAKPSFWLLAFGSGCSAMVGYGVMFWLPVFLNRSMGLSLVELSLFYGSIVLVGGAAGLWVGGALVDRLGLRTVRAYAFVPAIFAAAAAVFYAAALFAPSLTLAWPLFVLAQVMGMSWYAPVLAAMQQIAPASMRATVSSIYLLIQNIMGIAAGTFLFGFLSDRMSALFGTEALRFSILFCQVLYLAGSLLFALAIPRIGRDWATPRP